MLIHHVDARACSCVSQGFDHTFERETQLRRRPFHFLSIFLRQPLESNAGTGFVFQAHNIGKGQGESVVLTVDEVTMLLTARRNDLSIDYEV